MPRSPVVNHHGFSDFSLSELADETAHGAATETIDDFMGTAAASTPPGQS